MILIISSKGLRESEPIRQMFCELENMIVKFKVSCIRLDVWDIQSLEEFPEEVIKPKCLWLLDIQCQIRLLYLGDVMLQSVHVISLIVVLFIQSLCLQTKAIFISPQNLLQNIFPNKTFSKVKCLDCSVLFSRHILLEVMQKYFFPFEFSIPRWMLLLQSIQKNSFILCRDIRISNHI